MKCISRVEASLKNNKKKVDMKKYLCIATILAAMLSLASCADGYGEDSYYDPGFFESYTGPFMPIMDDEAVSVNISINGAWNASAIASGRMFDIYGIPAKPILDNLPGAEIVFDEDEIKFIEDKMVYTHDSYENIITDHVDSLGFEVLAHDMPLRVRQGDAVHEVVLSFPSTKGMLKIVTSNYLYYWRYAFSLKAERMLVDGVEQPINSPIEYVVNIYFSRNVGAKDAPLPEGLL